MAAAAVVITVDLTGRKVQSLPEFGIYKVNAFTGIVILEDILIPADEGSLGQYDSGNLIIQQTGRTLSISNLRGGDAITGILSPMHLQITRGERRNLIEVFGKK